jgi:hypothetical protein
MFRRSAREPETEGLNDVPPGVAEPLVGPARSGKASVPSSSLDMLISNQPNK